jgi:hypothetical protein
MKPLCKGQKSPGKISFDFGMTTKGLFLSWQRGPKRLKTWESGTLAYETTLQTPALAKELSNMPNSSWKG